MGNREGGVEGGSQLRKQGYDEVEVGKDGGGGALEGEEIEGVRLAVCYKNQMLNNLVSNTPMMTKKKTFLHIAK